MKKWRIVLLAALMLTLMCICVSALGECSHTNSDGTTALKWELGKARTCTEAGREDYKCGLCGHVEATRTIPAQHTPSSTWETTTAPTCTSNGLKVLRCTVCTQVVQSEMIAAAGHDIAGVAYTVVTPATCKADGVQARVCKTCSAAVETQVIPKLTADSAHNWNEVQSAVPATCTAAGTSALYECSVCGARKGGAAIPATGHDVMGVGYTDVLAPTCKAEGRRVRLCKKCGAEAEAVAIPRLTTHSWADIQSGTAPTCTAEGRNALSECTVCGAQKGGDSIPATGHDILGVAYTEILPATCKSEGIKAKQCKTCGASVGAVAIPKLTGDGDHSWAEIQSAVPATCTTAGQNALFECTVCGAKKGGNVLPATGHDVLGVSYTEIVAATCKDAGTKGKICKTCGVAAEIVAVPKTACKETDLFVLQPGTPATHSAPGKTDLKECAVCGKTTGGVVIPQIPHDLTGAFVEEKPATCKEPGLKVKRCKDASCNAVVDQQILPVIPCKEDTKTKVDSGFAATHSKPGKTDLYQCTVCGKYYGGTAIPALGHDKNLTWKDDPVATATCTKAGREIKVCSCGEVVDSRTKKKLGHVKSDWIIDTAATCTAEGSKHIECTRCHEVLQKAVINKTPHDISGVAWKTVQAPTCAAKGKEVKECKVCNAVAQSREMAKTACDAAALVELKPGVAMTCETNGVSATMQCPTCKKITGGQVIKASGHKKQDQIITAPTCTAEGLKKVICTNAWCNKGGLVQDNVKVPATGHKGEWKTLEPATPNKNGISVQICKVCGAELGRREIKYAEMMYDNTICSLGPCTRDLVGGKDWYRVTPIDLTQDGTYTYDLIASNKYTVGTATIVISNGKLTVTYHLNSSQIRVNSEALIFYRDLNALAAPNPANTVTGVYGQPVDIAQTFGEDTNIILSVFLKADYNAIGAGVEVFQPSQQTINSMADAMK